MPQPADWNRARKHDFGGAHGNNPFVAEWARRRQMIRSELLAALAQDNPELRAEEVEQVVDVFFEEIAQRLSEGGRVELRGFGAFSTREREARKGRNPRTGETVDVPAKRVPYFKPGKDMRRRLNDD
ncbi:MAG: integration host factor subunit beta [Sphingomonadales bacterium]